MEINLLKYFTLKRFINAAKIILSYTVSNFLKKPIVWGMPLSYSIEPTNYCNLKCPECPSGLGTLTRPLGLLQLEGFKEIVDQVYSTSFYLQLFFQGEPYMNKALLEMIKYARNKKMYISVSTNGHFISDKNVKSILSSPPDKIIYSMDGIDEESYKHYRLGGNFQKVESGLRILTEEKKKRKLKIPFIEMQFIVMKQNEHLLEKVKTYAGRIGVDKLVFKTMQITSIENIHKFLPVNEKYRRYSLNNNNLKVKARIKNKCFALWRTSVITWDGRVVPCCFDKDALHEYGKMNGSFSILWRSGKANSFRKEVLTNRRRVPMCTNCTEGLKVNITKIEN